MDNSNKRESRILRFQKLASKRTHKILHSLDVLGNCSNKSNYVYNQDQVDKIFKAIRDKVNETEMRFKAKKTTNFEL